MINRTHLCNWKALQAQAIDIQGQEIKQFFESDTSRFNRYSVAACGIFLDYSKNLLNADIVTQLLTLADDCELVK
jgi:glucose-6-phosphate isomerase